MASIPAPVKHVTLAVFKKAKLPGSTKDRFKAAYAIAISRCNEYGLVAGGKTTAKGRKHEQQGMENFVKNQLFDAMYSQYIDGDTSDPSKGQVIGKPPPPASDDAHFLGRNKKE